MGGRLVPFHVVPYTAECCLKESLKAGETIADFSLAVEINVLKNVLPVTHLNRHFP